LFLMIFGIIAYHLGFFGEEQFRLRFKTVAHIKTLLVFILIYGHLAFPKLTFDHYNSIIYRFFQIGAQIRALVTMNTKRPAIAHAVIIFRK
jgi:hypothetical protein